MADQGEHIVRENTWSRSFKDQLVWFGFAILLAFGGSYISTQSTTTKIKADIQALERRLDNTESNTKSNSEELQAIQKDLVRLEQKINALLKERGIQYENIDVQHNR
jgi:cell division protein FtsL